jgi:hypothetical protein
VANQYGIADNPYLAASYGCVSGADVTLTAGSEVTFITTGTIKTNLIGDFYPLIIGNLALAMGGSAPTALVLAFKLGSGSDVVTFTVAPAVLVASTTINIPFCFVGATSASAWFPTGSTINITGNATTNNGTAKNVGSYAVVWLVRGPNV